jgi:hypothetical protein
MEETPGSYEGDAGWVLSTRSRQGSDKRSGKKSSGAAGPRDERVAFETLTPEDSGTRFD